MNNIDEGFYFILVDSWNSRRYFSCLEIGLSVLCKSVKHRRDALTLNTNLSKHKISRKYSKVIERTHRLNEIVAAFINDRLAGALYGLAGFLVAFFTKLAFVLVAPLNVSAKIVLFFGIRRNLVEARAVERNSEA